MKIPLRAFKYSLVLIWGVFTISLTIWWYIYSIQLLSQLSSSQISEVSELARSHRMLFWEGAVLILCLLGGSIALGYNIFVEARRSQKFRNFFLTFSHELRTPLASLRLQAESLAEDLNDDTHREVVERIVSDTSRLAGQLENSLFLAQLNKSELLLEPIDLESFFESLQFQWPNIEIRTQVHGEVLADKRALESIFRNLIQNSVVHGKASYVKVSSEIVGKQIALTFEDNGQNFCGDMKNLARLFFRHYSGSGSGIGLYLCQKLAELMGGNVSFEPKQSGFASHLTLRRVAA